MCKVINFVGTVIFIYLMRHLRLLTISCLFFGVASCFAQNTLNIHQKDGAVVSYGFVEKPVVTYTATGIHLSTTKVEMDYPFTSLEQFTFSDNDANSINVLKTEGTNEDISIYDMRGMLVKTIKQSDGSASFSTSDLPQGTYIIKNGSTTYKIIKR